MTLSSLSSLNQEASSSSSYPLKMDPNARIPSKALGNIFTFLENSEVMKIKSVCHLWRKNAESDFYRPEEVSMTIKKMPRFASQKNLLKLLKLLNDPVITEAPMRFLLSSTLINTHTLMIFNRALPDLVLRHLPCLTKLSIDHEGGFPVTDTTLQNLYESNPQIQRLSLAVGSSISMKSITRFQKLTHLRLRGLQNFEHSNPLTSLVKLTLIHAAINTDEPLKYFYGYTQLTHLDLCNNEDALKGTTKDITSLISRLSQLRALTTDYENAEALPAFMNAASLCDKLEVLHLGYNPLAKVRPLLEKLSFPQLIEFNMHWAIEKPEDFTALRTSLPKTHLHLILDTKGDYIKIGETLKNDQNIDISELGLINNDFNNRFGLNFRSDFNFPILGLKHLKIIHFG